MTRTEARRGGRFTNRPYRNEASSVETPGDLKYSEDHEWVKVEGDTATVGITAYAQDSLGDVVFVELPEVGRTLTPGEAFGVVESVKAVSDIYSPVAGEVTAINTALTDTPETINAAPYGDGWMVRIRLAAAPDATKLMDAEAYAAFTSH